MGDYIVRQWGPWDEALQRQFFQERIDGGLMQVVEVDGGVAGIYESEWRADGLHVVNLEIAPWLQGKGIGTSILREALREAVSRNMAVKLQVLHFNPARTLYERLGFAVTGETESHTLMEWRPPAGKT